MNEYKDKISIGRAGEFYAAAYLEMNGFTTALPANNNKDFDILAINRETTKMFAIQVKTTINRENKWILTKKAEDLVNDNLYYIFVKIFEGNPNYYVVPSKKVSEYVIKENRDWLAIPGKNGKQHSKDNSIRTFKDLENKYLNKIDLIK